MLASLAEREGLDTEEALNLATVTVAAMRGLLLQKVLTPAAHSEDAVALILRMGAETDPVRGHDRDVYPTGSCDIGSFRTCRKSVAMPRRL